MNEQEAPVIPAYFSMVSPVPCADCRQPVRLEIQQEYTKDRFGRVLCLDCEEKAIEKAASQLRECCNSCILYKNNICYGCTLSSPLPSYCEEGGRES